MHLHDEDCCVCLDHYVRNVSQDGMHVSWGLNICCETFHKEKSNKMQLRIQIFVIPHLYEAQHVSGNTPPFIRSLKLHWQLLVLHMWKAVGCVVEHCQAQCAWKHPPATRPTTFHVWKTGGCQCSFRLLMKGGVSPETCWASYKYGIINFDTLFLLVGFSVWKGLNIPVIT
jgi:hypothetical protein